MKVALITLSQQGAALAEALAMAMPHCSCYVHQSVDALPTATRFERIVTLTSEAFGCYEGIVFIMPCGVATRAIAPLISHKLTDPAIVVVDIAGRWAIPLLSGHEGGANALAADVANILGAEPIITTTTEAIKTIVAGVGCRRGTSVEQITAALESAVARADLALSDIRLLASADIKRDEAGLLEAANRLAIPIRFIASDEIRHSTREFTRSDFVQDKVNLPAVAEPAALLAGTRTRLLLPKQISENVTVALARENCMWSA